MAIRLLMMLLIILGAGCRKDISEERILFDFESDAELDRLHWSCRTLYSLSDEHAAHGLKSLKMELFPSDYPGLSPLLPLNDWRGYKQLCFDIYNPSENPVKIGVRIDDRKDYPDYADRYNKGFVISKGGNHIVIPLDTMVASGTRRRLDPARIRRLMIFAARPEKKITLYLDSIKLVR